MAQKNSPICSKSGVQPSGCLYHDTLKREHPACQTTNEIRNDQRDHHHHASVKEETTSWTLFIIFVLGPCEPLIPLLMYPAARNSIFDVVLVTIVFSLVTISTMLAVVAISIWGISRIRFGLLEKYAHVLSGLAIFLCGIAVKFFNV